MGLTGVFNLVADPAFPNELKSHVTMDKPDDVLDAAKEELNGLVTQRLLDGCEVTAKIDGTGFNVVVLREEGESNKQWAERAKGVADALSYRMASIGNTTHNAGRIYCEVPAGSMTKEAFEEQCNAPQGADKIDFETALFDELGASGNEPSQGLYPDPCPVPIVPPFPEMGAANGLMADVVLAGSDVTKMVDGTGFNVVVPREEGESNKQWAVRTKCLADGLDELGVEIKNETHKGGRIYCAVSGDNAPEVNGAFERACKRTEIRGNFEAILNCVSERLKATDPLGGACSLEKIAALCRSAKDVFGGGARGECSSPAPL